MPSSGPEARCRSAQLTGLRPDLQTAELRGNVETRLRKVLDGEVDAAILAEAGLSCLGRTDAIEQRLDSGQMVPAPGQGALAVEARIGSAVAELAAMIDDTALRRFSSMPSAQLLAETGAGCRSALGALAMSHGDQIRLIAFVADVGRPPPQHSPLVTTPESVVGCGARTELGL